MLQLPENIDENTIDELVIISLDFMRVLGKVYGNEEAISTFNQFREVLSPEIQGLIMQALLGNNKTLTVRFKGPYSNKIMAMKALRTATQVTTKDVYGNITYQDHGLGLKESKDLIDASCDRIQHFRCASLEQARTFRNEIRKLTSNSF